MHRFATVIVGAGPAGSYAAHILASTGLSVAVFEEHATVGVPEHCTGLVSASGFNSLALPSNFEKTIVNTIYGAKIYSPSEICIEVERKEPVAYVLNREFFDKKLASLAENSGAELFFNSKVLDFRGNKLFYKCKNRGELAEFKYLIGTDGVLSSVRKALGITIPKEYFVHAYQERVSGSFDKEKVLVFMCKEAKGFFAWLVPENNNIARVGIGVSLGNNPKIAFEKFKRHLSTYVDLEDTLSSFSAIIPVGPPVKAHHFNVLLAGDSAFHTKATTGGGIIFGLKAAFLCAESVKKALLEGKSIKSCETTLSKLEKELLLHWRIRKALNSLSSKAMDKLFLKLKNADISEFLETRGNMDEPSKFVFKMLSIPKFWPALLTFVSKGLF